MLRRTDEASVPTWVGAQPISHLTLTSRYSFAHAIVPLTSTSEPQLRAPARGEGVLVDGVVEAVLLKS
jgi:hypothetical protein